MDDLKTDDGVECWIGTTKLGTEHSPLSRGVGGHEVAARGVCFWVTVKLSHRSGIYLS